MKIKELNVRMNDGGFCRINFEDEQYVMYAGERVDDLEVILNHLGNPEKIVDVYDVFGEMIREEWDTQKYDDWGFTRIFSRNIVSIIVILESRE